MTSTIIYYGWFFVALAYTNQWFYIKILDNYLIKIIGLKWKLNFFIGGIYMKKAWSILAGTLISTLVSLTSCVYLGLPPKKVKQHNEAIKQQLPEFSLDNFNGSFYYIPECEGKSITFSSKDGKREYLIKTNKSLSYFDGTTKKPILFLQNPKKS